MATTPVASGLQFRSGHMTTAFCKPYTGDRLIMPETTSDPAVQAGISNIIGTMPSPGVSITNNFGDVQTIGSARDVAKWAGRKEVTIQNRIQLSDPRFMLYCVRDHTNPGKAGTIQGLPLLAFEIGTGSEFGAAAEANQYLDCLINTWRLDFAEGQPVSLDTGIFAMCELPVASPQGRNPADGVILLWHHASWIVNGYDYKPWLSRIGLQGSNTVTREGTRNQYGELGPNELAISRTPLGLVPHYETIAANYGLRDQLPAALRNSADWGAVTLYAEQPGTGSNRRWLKIVIDHNHMNNENRNQTQANQPLSFTADTSSRVVTITAGLTNPPGAV